MKYNRSQISWITYDFANSAFHLLIPTVLFPLYFKQVLFKNSGTIDFYWSISVSIPMLITGFISPFIGAYVDKSKTRKKFFNTTCLLTIALCFSLSVASPDVPIIPICLFSFSLMLFNMSLFVYDSFLPSQKQGKGTALLSGYGWGIGYLGGILCMLLVFKLINNSKLPSGYYNYQEAFVIVAAFYFLFALPSLIFLKDHRDSSASSKNPSSSFRNVISTLKNWRDRKEIFKFLISFYLINDGLSTLVFFTSLFASKTLGMTDNQIMTAFLIVQAIGIPATILICWISEYIGYKRTLLITVAIWVFIALAFLLINSSIHLYILSIFVGFVIGSTPALARAILGTMVKGREVTEIYGFHALSSRVSSTVGPLIFGLVSTTTGSQTLALSSLTVFFLLGFIVLISVKVEENKAGALILK